MAYSPLPDDDVTAREEEVRHITRQHSIKVSVVELTRRDPATVPDTLRAMVEAAG